MTDQSAIDGTGLSHTMVENGHHLAVTKRGAHQTIPREWRCRGCGDTFDSRNDLDECPNPTLWVFKGCPGDGLGHCRNCNAVFVFERPVNPPHEHGCPNCDSVDWFRTDETPNEVDPASVIYDV